MEQARTEEWKVGRVIERIAEGKVKENREERRRRINSIFSVHHVSLTLPVDPGPAHMSAHQCAYVSTIT